MQPYPVYKDSGIEWLGEIPNHWRVTRPKYLSTRIADYGLNIASSSYTDSGIRFIRTTDIDDDGHLTSEGVFLSEEDVEPDYLLANGDFLISRSGTVGRAYVHNQYAGDCTYYSVT